MSELQVATMEEDEWTDTDSSEVEADTVTFYHKTDLEREQSLVLTALGLSQADSDQRKPFRSDLTSRRDFFNLPREIRNRIYDHLTFLPLEIHDQYAKLHELDQKPYRKSDWAQTSRNLAQTCRQAKAECDEEFALRLWNRMKCLEATHLYKTGSQLTFSNRASSHDLLGVESLEAIIRGPFPNRWPGRPSSVFGLPVHEITIHCTGGYDAPTLHQVQRLFDTIYYSFRMFRKPSQGPRLITLSWNRQAEKRDITLIERTFEASRLDPKNAKFGCAPLPAGGAEQRLTELPIEANATWPSIKVGLSKDMEVGYCKLKRYSHPQPLIYHDWSMAEDWLTHAFTYADNLDDVCPRSEGRTDLKVYETEIQYKVGEDE